MGLEGEINLIISQAFSAILLVAQASAVVLWNVLLTQGFDPAQSYLLVLNPGVNFFGGYERFLNSTMPELTGAVLAVFALFFIYSSSVGEKQATHKLFKPIFAILLSIFSIEIIQGILSAEVYIYNPIWNSGVNWPTLIPQTTQSGLFSGNGLVRLLFIAGYDVPMISIYVVLAVRTSLIIFSYLVLPFASLLIIIPYMEKYSITLWKTVVESTALPIFMLLALYPMYIVEGNTMVQIGSLFLCSSIPILFVERARIFGNMVGSLSSVIMFESIFERTSIPGILTDRIPDIGNTSTAAELNRLGMPNTVNSNYGSQPNSYAIDWNEAYQKSYSEHV